jgi:DNA-directed RNA polymerase subunit K/omega
LYYASIEHAFKSDVILTEIENPALNINSNQKDDYGFNIGITLLQEILKTLGLGTFEIGAKITSGKSVTISYDNSVTKEYTIGNIEEYFFAADFLHPNPSLLKNANRNYILVITGTVFAKNLIVDIETDFALDDNLVASLNEIASGKLDFTVSNKNKLNMTSNAEIHFPIAVKASRLDYDRSRFQKLILVTDNNNIF